MARIVSPAVNIDDLCSIAGTFMGTFRDLQDFVHHVRGVTTLPDLHELLQSTVLTFGFQYYALGHHVRVVQGELLQIGNYPDAWMQTVHTKQYISDDPVLRACQNTAVGFRWSEVDKLIDLSSRQREILASASRAGMGEGFTVPVHIPGECTGSCSFAHRIGKPLNEAVLPAAHCVGGFAFEAARRLVRHTGAPKRSLGIVEFLTTRQLDCVVLVARGKSDWEAAKILGLSQDTVHQHVETAKRKYGVATRTQLVIRALFDNQLGFEEVISR
jgi:LuxR family quorum-sensing system transcriptional regulator CciR